MSKCRLPLSVLLDPYMVAAPVLRARGAHPSVPFEWSSFTLSALAVTSGSLRPPITVITGMCANATEGFFYQAPL